MSGLASYEIDGRIATITMDDGKVNALSIEMLKELHGLFDRAEREQAVVILTGREKYLSAGFDLNVFAAYAAFGDLALDRPVTALTLKPRLARMATATEPTPPAAPVTATGPLLALSP